MALIHNRRELGLFGGGPESLDVENDFVDFDAYATRTGKRRGLIENVYGSGAYQGPRIRVYPNDFWYTFSGSTYTLELSYNNRTASGHMGIRQYDSSGNIIRGYNNGGTGNTTLSRAASPGDTVIYVADASAWYTGTSSNSAYATFFPSDGDMGPTEPYYYSRYVKAYDSTGSQISQTGQGDWEVQISGTLPDWGFSYSVGTLVSNGRGSNSNSYIITGNTNHNNLGKWRTFKSTPRHGERINGGDFYNGVVKVSFLHLRNYTYRSESAGDSAKYLIGNILALRRPDNRTIPLKVLQKGLEGEFY